MEFIESHLNDMKQILEQIEVKTIHEAVLILSKVNQNRGRLFIIGVGGSAANASHAVNDFRKLANIEAYAPTDNVAELTARTNDDGWERVFSDWLRVSNLGPNDVILVLSVGGGNEQKNISINLVKAIRHAHSVGAKVISIVGRDDGYAFMNSTVSILIPTVNPEFVTPHAETYQAAIWHLFVSHPLLKFSNTKWESLEK
jgi:D-sedoheptulose 7-phosphate isomerase